MFSLWCSDWVGSLYANRFFMYFCFKSSIGAQGGWLAVKVVTPAFPPAPAPLPSAVVPLLNGLLYWQSKAEVPVALWFILRGDLFYVLPCVILLLCFSVLLALRLPRLGKRELILVLFVLLFDFCLFWFCWFPLPLGVWEGLRFVIVALPGLFSYLFFDIQSNLNSWNTDGSFTMANSNSVLSPYEILPMDQENKYLRKFSYFIMKLYVVCTD